MRNDNWCDERMGLETADPLTNQNFFHVGLRRFGSCSLSARWNGNCVREVSKDTSAVCGC